MSNKYLVHDKQQLKYALKDLGYAAVDKDDVAWRYQKRRLEYEYAPGLWEADPGREDDVSCGPWTVTTHCAGLATESDPPEPVVLKQPERWPNLLNATSAERKEMPMHTGCIMYFPDALAAIARVSFLSNEKHNPGQPLFWSYGKSADHADAEIRHSTNKGGLDPEDKVPEVYKKAWRAVADAQEYAEKQDPELHAFRQAQRDRQAKGE